MPEGLRVRLLGPLEVTCAAADVGPAGSLRRALLAVLAVHANTVVRTADLADGLWADRAPGSAAGLVQTYVSTWRKALHSGGDGRPDRIATAGSGYRLALSVEESDVLRFDELTARGRRAAAEGRHGESRVALAGALALWRGAPLVELAALPFHAHAVRPLEDRRVQAVEDWAGAVLHDGGADAELPRVVHSLESLRTEQPWRERTVELLMWALFRQGRQGESLDLWQHARRALADDLGVDPGPGLRAMHERVLRHDRALLPAATSPVATSRAPPRPVRLDGFVGRERELAELADLLRVHRLVTLTGTGGSGKTRLAEQLLDRPPSRAGAGTAGDAVVVRLASVADTALVPGTIAARLGLDRAEPLDSLVSLLADRPLLLVLDNVEHLPGIAATVGRLLHGTRSLRVLATSREPLRVRGEQQFALAPLPVPAAGEVDAGRIVSTPSVELLVARARASAPDFRVTAADAGAVGRIVRLLDGLPLAIEIVAPWLAPLTPAGVLEQIRHPLDLEARAADTEPRHRNLRSTIAWSYDRLSRPQRVLLDRLSVFRGGAGLAAIRAVAGDDLGGPVVDVLLDLVDRNLVQRAGAPGQEPRFRLLETVRAFAAERLAAAGGTGDVERRAAAWFGRWAGELARHSEGPGTAGWLERAVADADNLRAAADDWTGPQEPAARLQFLVDAMVLWYEAGHEREGERRLTAALAEAPPAAGSRPIALAYLAWFVMTHDRPRAAALAREAVALARHRGDAPVLAFALQTLGDAADDFDTARAAALEAQSLAHGLDPGAIRYGPTAGDAVACGTAHTLAALWAHRSLPTALDWQRRAVTLAEEEGDRRITGVSCARLGLLHLLGGDVAAARGPVERAVSSMTGPVTARWEDIVAYARAELLRHDGDGDAAEAAYRALVAAALRGGRLLHVDLASCGLTDVLVDRGALRAAADVLHVAEAAVAASGGRSARLLVRRARLLRLDERRSDATAALAQAEALLDPAALAPERVVWFVESALLTGQADRRLLTERLEGLSARTGVRVPPEERRWLDDAPRGA